MADALANYDKDDVRNIKFLDFQVKQQGNGKEHKDFININKQKLAESQGQPASRQERANKFDSDR